MIFLLFAISIWLLSSFSGSSNEPLFYRLPLLVRSLDYAYASPFFFGSDIGGLVPRRRCIPNTLRCASSYLAALERLLRPRVHHIVYYPECYSGISAMPSRPLGLNAGVAHAASIDSSFPPTFFSKIILLI